MSTSALRSTADPVPFSNPKAQYLSHRAEIEVAIARVLAGGRYILGEEVRAFEAEFAAYIGCQFGIGVGSGTDALHVALRACGIGPGDEVITVPHTAVATVAAIELCGATPVMIDIEPVHYTMDPARLECLIGPRTKAVIPVHIYGQAANLTAILEIARRHGIRVIEDCAQAHGAWYHGKRVGAWADISCFSFYPTKNLGAIGDGGLIVTDDPTLAERARLLREYGWSERYVSSISGMNSRLDELQAAILRVKLSSLDQDNASRARLAAIYDEELAESNILTPARRPDAIHVFHLYVIRSQRRDELQAFLQSHGVGALVHYPVPVHLQPAYRSRLGRRDSCEEAERAAREVLSLPMFPELSEEDVRMVAGVVRDFERGAST